MSAFWESKLDSCPVCGTPVKLKEGPISVLLTCPECEAELEIRPKHLKWLVVACVASGLIITAVQGVAAPFFPIVSSVYSFLLLIALRQFVMPLMPQELTRRRQFITSLRLGSFAHK